MKHMIAKVFLAPALRGKVTWWESCKEGDLRVRLGFSGIPSPSKVLTL